MATKRPTPSNTQADKAGRTLRTWWCNRRDAEISDEVVQAWITLEAFRRSFQNPLQKTTVGLRQFVARESPKMVVGQRSKRTPRILDKLERFPTTRLSQMQDIGGCRAILEGGALEVAGVLTRIRRNWEIVEIDDYVQDPKPGGYRAVHVIVRRDDRQIEIQLRSLLQHEWAETVERLQARHRIPLKDGSGPPELLRYMELVR
jgi:putative GTP pyrophosphokinase